MAQVDLAQIKLSSGGRILDGPPENVMVLDQINDADQISAVSLLKLASFHRNYSKNRQLADHLALLALRQVLQIQGIQEVITRAVPQADEAKSPNEFADGWEDFWNGYIDDEDKEEGHPDPARKVGGENPARVAVGQQIPANTVGVNSTDSIAICWIPSSEIGLLIESHTRSSATGKKATHYHIIGFSPAPDELPK